MSKSASRPRSTSPSEASHPSAQRVVDIDIGPVPAPGSPVRPLTDVVPIRSLAECLSAVSIIERAASGARLSALGAWTPAQNCGHCGMLLSAALDGIDVRLNWPMRVAGRVARGAALGPRPLPTGVRLRGPLRAFEPAAGMTMEEGVEALRTPLSRIVLSGQTMSHPSPLFGALDHEQWTTLQVKHLRHHLGFVGIQSSLG